MGRTIGFQLTSMSAFGRLTHLDWFESHKSSKSSSKCQSKTFENCDKKCTQINKYLFRGRIVNVSSCCGRIAFAFTGPYTVSKYAVEAYSDTIRLAYRITRTEIRNVPLNFSHLRKIKIKFNGIENVTRNVTVLLISSNFLHPSSTRHPTMLTFLDKLFSSFRLAKICQKIENVFSELIVSWISPSWFRVNWFS